MKFDLKLSDLINLPTTFLTAILISSGIVLFSPEELLRQLYILDFQKKHGFIIGLVFICCLSLLVVNLIYQAAQSVKKNRNQRNFYANAEARLRKLNNYQKALVYLLFTQDNRTHPLPLHDGAVLELEANMIIGKATNQYFVSDLNNALFPYLLQPWVSDELSNKENLLDDFRHAYNIQSNKITSMNNWEW
ncbi:superinfection exclusion B family protein [Paenibacillus dendritiformis]|uniref:superinfection exclusion B family protein n=1 Tax=Paenibacillus dendritiformis TaxID=130049 RepID=UPI00387E1B02